MPIPDTTYNKIQITGNNNPFLYWGGKDYDSYVKERDVQTNRSYSNIAPYFSQIVPLDENDFNSYFNLLYKHQVYSIHERSRKNNLLPSEQKQLKTKEAFDEGTIGNIRNTLDDTQPYVTDPFSFGVDDKGKQKEIPNYKYKTDEDFYKDNPQLGLSYEYLQQIGATRNPRTGELIQPDKLGIYFPYQRVGTIPFLAEAGLTDWMAKDNDRNFDNYCHELERLYGISGETLKYGLEGVEYKELENGDKILFFKKDVKDAKGKELAYKLLTSIPTESLLYNMSNTNQTMVYGYDSNGNIINKDNEKDPQAIERFGNFVLSSLVARLGIKGLNKIFGKGLSKIGGVFNKTLNKTLEKTADAAKNKTIKNKAADWWYDRQTKTIKPNTRGVGVETAGTRNYAGYNRSTHKHEIEVIPGNTPYLFNKPSIGTAVATAAGIPLGTATYDDVWGHEEGDITSLTDKAAFDDLNYRWTGHSMDMRRIISMKNIYEGAKDFKDNSDKLKYDRYLSGQNTINYTDDYIVKLYDKYEEIKTETTDQKLIDSRWNDLQKAIESHIFGNKGVEGSSNVEGGVVGRCKTLMWQPDCFYIEDNGSLRPVKDQDEWSEIKKQINVNTEQTPIFHGLYLAGDIMGPDIAYVDKDGKNKHLVVDKIFTNQIEQGIFSDPKSYASLLAFKFDEDNQANITFPHSGIEIERHGDNMVIINNGERGKLEPYNKAVVQQEAFKDYVKASVSKVLPLNYKVNNTFDEKNAVLQGYIKICKLYGIPIPTKNSKLDNEAFGKTIEEYFYKDPNTMTTTEQRSFYELKEIESYMQNLFDFVKIGVAVKNKQNNNNSK